MTTKIDQKEYLKKYLSGDKKKKKKDKKSKSKSQATVKIIDDDVHESHGPEIDEELLLTGEDAPQIVGIVTVTGEPPENKWKSIGGIKKEEKSDDDPWGKKDTSNVNQSPKRRKDQSRRNSDQSPPRPQKAPIQNTNGRDFSNGKRSRWNSDQAPVKQRSPIRSRKESDQSPQRKRSPVHSRRDSDQSPQRKRPNERLRRDSDQSPQRKRSPVHSRKDSDQSPQRKRPNDRLRRDSDHSPQRKRPNERLREGSDQSPTRKRTPVRSRRDSDQSPSRRRTPSRSRRDSDQSPPRRKTTSTNQVEPRIKREFSSDLSPPRRRDNANPFKSKIKIKNPSPDNSPQRGNRQRASDSPPPTHKPSLKMTKTLDGKRAGLQDASALRIETEERRRNEDKMFDKMSKEVSGRDAEVQVRKSSYRRHRKYEEEDPEVQRKKAEHEEKKKELYSRWNRGVKQIEAIQAKISDDQYESSKPLARYSNDADLDEMLRQKEYEDDPMLAYIRSKKKEQQMAANVPVIPKYKGSYPENRFGIPPGYRWDGVDRSNGYEKKYFDVQSSKQAAAEEAYLYSVEDM